MSNPNQVSPTDNNTEHNKWDDLSEIEFSPISVSTDGVSKLTLSDAPMGEGRQDKRIDATDASGTEKRTSNLMLGYNEKGVQIGETYLSIEEFREKALKNLEEDTEDEVLYFVRKDTDKRFAEPRAVVDDMLATITGAGPEATLSDNTKITNQDARSVEFSGPNGETQRGVLMFGNEGVQMPNGIYAEAGTIDSVIDNYAKAIKKEVPIPPSPPEGNPTPPTPPEDDSMPPKTPEPFPDTREIEDTPNKDLRQATLDLAELYAKNRRLLAGPGTREKFEAAKKEYQQLLVEHLSSLGHSEYTAGFGSLSTGIQTMATELAIKNNSELVSFAGGDLEHPTKTPEEIEAKREELRREAEAKMKEKYPDMVDGLETTVTSKIIEEYAKSRAELEEATIDALDNGTVCRKAVSKIITNKWVKRGLMAAAAAGLAVAAVGMGHGVADGSLAVSFGYTAGGIMAGSIRGGLSGALMSRQDSKTSAIRNYGDDVAGNIEERIKAGERITAEDLATEAMSDYATANQSDLRSNRLKTAVSAGVGATIGAAASGIHVDNVVHSTTTERVQTGTTPEQYDVDLSKIDIHEGSGMGETFTDLGGDPTKISEAVKIAHQFDSQYGMVPGSNSIVPGAGDQVGDFAHTYPGTIDTWPQQAREYITQVAQKWAEDGLIDATKTGGEPIFSIVEKTVINYIPNLFYNALIQAEATVIPGVIGGTASLSKEPKQETPSSEETPATENTKELS